VALKPARPRLKPDRFKSNRKAAAFFEKKRRKKLLFAWARGGETSAAQIKQGFLLLFVHKKKSSFPLIRAFALNFACNRASLRAIKRRD
jgi:hypothetical protein